MTLEFDTGQKIEEPCGNQIAEAVGGLPNRKDSFVVLSAARTNYIQVAADRSEKFTLEFQEGNRTRHFRAREKLGHDEVVDVLVRYSRGDLKWKTTVSWQQDAIAPGRTRLMTATLVLWALGLIVMVPAFVVREWWANRLVALGSEVESVGCIANIISAVLHQRMWGRFSIVTPDGLGGVILFRVFVFFHVALAAIWAWCGAAFVFPLA